MEHKDKRMTDLEEQNRKLKSEADCFHIITAHMNDGLFIINRDGTYDYFNEQAKKMTQHPESIQAVGDSLLYTAYYDTDGRRLTKDEIPSARVLRGETLNNIRLRAESSGISGYYSYSGCPVYNENGDLTSAIICFRNITEIYQYEQQIYEQKKQLEIAVKRLEDQKELLEETIKELHQSVTDKVLAEKNVRKLSKELRNIIDSTEDLIWSVDRDYRLLFFNASFKNAVEKIFGYTLKEGILLKELFAEETYVWAEFYERAITEGKFQIDLTSPFNDRMFSYNFYPIYVNSEIVEVTCFAKDQTERMKTEQRIINQNSMLEMTVRERTAELQQMVRNLKNFSLALSHDVKASYRDIELCAGKILKNTDIEANAERILKVSTDMTAFILEIMKYEMYTRQALVKVHVNIKKMFTTVYKELKTLYSNQSQLAFETGFPIISADKILLQQVVYNIMSNALKFSSKRPLAAIKVGCVEENDEYVIYMKDNGIGFDMDDAAKLFSAFERLHHKEDYEGNGLGLYIVRNIIHRHSGKVWIKSEPDIGTAVYFTLPKL